MSSFVANFFTCGNRKFNVEFQVYKPLDSTWKIKAENNNLF